MWNVPGGKVEKLDWSSSDRLPAYRRAVRRELWEELEIGNCEIGPAIGPPLYAASRKDGVLLSVDSAQAFLVKTTDIPKTSLESVAVSYCHQASFAGFNVVGRRADPNNLQFGRTPIIIFDGLSVLQEPFYVGKLTQELKDSIIGDPGQGDFILLDGGNYLARMIFVQNKDGWNIAIYYRLNPDQPDGRFHGAFDHMAT